MESNMNESMQFPQGFNPVDHHKKASEEDTRLKPLNPRMNPVYGTLPVLAEGCEIDQQESTRSAGGYSKNHPDSAYHCINEPYNSNDHRSYSQNSSPNAGFPFQRTCSTPGVFFNSGLPVDSASSTPLSFGHPSYNGNPYVQYMPQPSSEASPNPGFLPCSTPPSQYSFYEKVPNGSIHPLRMPSQSDLFHDDQDVNQDQRKLPSQIHMINQAQLHQAQLQQKQLQYQQWLQQQTSNYPASQPPTSAQKERLPSPNQLSKTFVSPTQSYGRSTSYPFINPCSAPFVFSNNRNPEGNDKEPKDEKSQPPKTNTSGNSSIMTPPHSGSISTASSPLSHHYKDFPATNTNHHGYSYPNAPAQRQSASLPFATNPNIQQYVHPLAHLYPFPQANFNQGYEEMNPAMYNSMMNYYGMNQMQNQHTTIQGGLPIKICSNCGCTSTPSWRRCPNGKALLCNACGLYQKLHNKPRPFCVLDDGSVKVQRSSLPEHNICANCSTTETPLWRRGSHGECLCNACGLYFKQHKSRMDFLSSVPGQPYAEHSTYNDACQPHPNIGPFSFGHTNYSSSSSFPSSASPSPPVASPNIYETNMTRKRSRSEASYTTPQSYFYYPNSESHSNFGYYPTETRGAYPKGASDPIESMH